MNIFIDIETIPDQTDGALDRITEEIEVKVPSNLTKPDLMKALETSDKYKTVPELKQDWLDKFGEHERSEQGHKKWLNTALDGDYGQIICICTDDDQSKFSMISADERALLSEFWVWVGRACKQKPPYFIAHNTSFDLPFIWKRSIINGVKPNKYFEPYSKRTNTCTMEMWAGYNGRIGLDRLANILGVEGKTEGFCGADIWPAWKEWQHEEIKTYCENDVEVLKNVYKKMTLN